MQYPIFFSLHLYISLFLNQGLDDRVNELFMPVALAWDKFVFTPISFGIYNLPIVFFLLTFGAFYFTIIFKFPGITKFKLAIQTVQGKFDSSSDLNEKQEGEVTHFQALTTAVSGTVGLGNIAGVAVAIALGGPGATFWMIICGLLGMAKNL